MIVAKTRMKEMPKTCTQCNYRTLYHGFGEDFCRIAGAFCPWEKKPNGMVGLGKPDWCPLMDAAELSERGQLVEVVRCLDCEVPHNKYTGCPNLNGLVTPHDFYCPFGKRKDGDGNG